MTLRTPREMAAETPPAQDADIRWMRETIVRLRNTVGDHMTALDRQQIDAFLAIKKQRKERGI